MTLTVQDMYAHIKNILSRWSGMAQFEIFNSPSAVINLVMESNPGSNSIRYKAVIYDKKRNETYYAFYRFQVYPDRRVVYNYYDYRTDYACQNANEQQFRPPVGLPKSVREAVRNASIAIAKITGYEKGDTLH